MFFSYIIVNTHSVVNIDVMMATYIYIKDII